MTLYGLINRRAAGRRAAKPFLEDARSERTVTYAELGAAVRAWGGYAVMRDVPAGASVIIDVADPLSFAVIHLAVIANGGRSVPVDPDAPWSAVGRAAELSGNAALIVSDRDGTGPAALAVVKPDVILAYASVGTGTDETPGRSPGAVILFTSGSTGTPKGVEMDERQLLYVAGQVARHHALAPSDRGYNSLPLFHINAEVVGLLATLRAGATLILDRRFHKSGFWPLMDERRVTWINAVPAIMAILARESDLAFPPGLRFIRSASAAFPDALREAFDRTTLVISYGMTEAASQITATPLDQPLRPGSVGTAAGVRIEVRDEHGRPLAPDTPGMLWIKGRGVVTRYYGNEGADRFDAGGWLKTGDTGQIDADGYVTLLGRSDDVINRGGEKLYPIEIENVILQDPSVREVVVTARPDDILGQVPVAYVIGVSGDERDAAGLRNRLKTLCERDLPRFKRPSDIIVMRDLPRAPTGKVRRAELRTLASAGTLGDAYAVLAPGV